MNKTESGLSNLYYTLRVLHGLTMQIQINSVPVSPRFNDLIKKATACVAADIKALEATLVEDIMPDVSVTRKVNGDTPPAA